MDWDTGDTDITQKPRAPSPAKLRKVYKQTRATLPADDDDYEPSFFCSFPKREWVKIRIQPLRTQHISKDVEYVLKKDGDSFLKLQVYENGVLQCYWNCSRDDKSNGIYDRIRAWWYDWVNQERTFTSYRHPYTNAKEYGWGPDLFGKIVFGFRWQTTHTLENGEWCVLEKE